MNNTPTPETDAVIASDMGDSTHLSDMEALCRKLERERDQLRKVSDDFADTVRMVNAATLYQIAIDTLEIYSQLPHVIERKRNEKRNTNTLNGFGN